MSVAQIVKKTQNHIPMEAGVNNRLLQQVHEGRTQQPTYVDSYQQMTIDSDALVDIDNAWLDAQESSKMDSDTINSESPITNSTINTDMVVIKGFHKDCPTDTILEIMKIFNTNYSIKIDIAYATVILQKSYLD